MQIGADLSSNGANFDARKNGPRRRLFRPLPFPKKNRPANAATMLVGGLRDLIVDLRSGLLHFINGIGF